jgi:hypothetical protein
MAINEVPHKSILTPTGGFLASGYGVRIWGIDKKGQLINSLFTCTSARIAQCAATSALGDLGARVHFLIRPMNGEDLQRLLPETEASPLNQQAAPTQRTCSSTRR